MVAVADQLFLLGVDRDHRTTPGHGLLDRRVDVMELGIAVRVIDALFGLTVAPQAVVESAQQGAHLGVTDRMLVAGESFGQRASTLHRPAQR